MPDGSYLMDSYKIAEYIEEKHPLPSLLLNTPTQLRFRDSLINFMGKLQPIYVPRVATQLLGEESLEYFLTTRQEDTGMPLDEFGKQQGPGAFERCEPFAREITALLNESSSGPYFMGDTISYTDLMWAGILLFFKRFGTEVYQEVLRVTGDAGAHTRLLDALSPWTARED
jgi:glutathione S-transferase